MIHSIIHWFWYVVVAQFEHADPPRFAVFTKLMASTTRMKHKKNTNKNYHHALRKSENDNSVERVPSLHSAIHTAPRTSISSLLVKSVSYNTLENDNFCCRFSLDTRRRAGSSSFSSRSHIFDFVGTLLAPTYCFFEDIKQ